MQGQHETGSRKTVLAPLLRCTSQSITSRLKQATIPLYIIASTAKKERRERTLRSKSPQGSTKSTQSLFPSKNRNSVSGWLQMPGIASLPPK